MKLYLKKNRTNLYDNGYTVKEEEIIYDNLLEVLYNNPRYYLDKLGSLTTFRLSWHNYSSNRSTLPLKYVKKAKLYK